MRRLITLGAIAGWTGLALVVGMAATSSASGPAAGRPAVAPVPPPGGAQPAIPGPLRPAALEAVFHAITPCRIVDTRLQGGPLGDGTTRTYYVGGTTGFVAQGGKSGGCGIPVGATAIAASMTAPTPAHLGAIRAWPAGTTEPTATVLAYSGGNTAGTGATLSIDHTAALALKVKNYKGPTNIFIDVTGYYAQQMEGLISQNGNINAGSSRIVSATNNALGQYQVTFDTDVSNCTPTATASGYSYASAFTLGGNKVQVYVWYLSQTTHLEVPFDGSVYVSVLC